ncbi:SMP-30/gluconolactonase/LRE family protein [Gymnodinialimonas ulvae]|uniref:SMP-30/gluconolactonase/LRE family protein n=1 Tax=Gymnodinialimonas ulvae TaxID=3126504 RepID=UPI00309575BA
MHAMGGCVLRLSPDRALVEQIDLPATNITACCFGGPDLRTLSVTTAANPLCDADLEDPHEGAFLAVKPGVAGPSPFFFRA